MRRILIAIPLAALLAAALPAQQPKASSVIGTVTAVKIESAEIELRRDDGSPATLRLSADTILQRVNPGEKDLKQAQPSTLNAVAVGDRALASFTPATTEPRRIIIMAAGEIAKRNESDHQDWIKRGLAGVVTAKTADSITLRVSSMAGEKTFTVAVAPSTKFRRYSPDSVRFSEARDSKLSEVSVGDQLRARGKKNEDGTHIDAEEAVFGTFVTKAGAITAVNLDTKEVTLKELGSNKPLTIRISADSQLKSMPSFGGMGGPGGGMMGGPGMGGPGMGGPGGGPGMGGPGGMRPGGGPPDLAQMLERMPATKLEDLKPGANVVVSSTKGSKNNEFTAIMFLANADMLIQIAQAQNTRQNARNGAANNGAMGGMSGGSMGMGGMGMDGGLGGLDLSGIGGGGQMR